MYVAAGSHVGYKYLVQQVTKLDVKKRPEEPSRSMSEFEEVLGGPYLPMAALTST